MSENVLGQITLSLELVAFYACELGLVFLSMLKTIKTKPQRESVAVQCYSLSSQLSTEANVRCNSYLVKNKIRASSTKIKVLLFIKVYFFNEKLS